MTLDPRRRLAAALVAVVSVLMLTLVALAPVAAQDQTPSTSPGVVADECVEPEPSVPPPPDETLSMPEDFRVQLFEGVWGGIRDFYVDPEVGGLDWEAIGDEYARLIIGTDNAYEVYELLTEMVGLLEDPYTNFFAPEDLADPETVDPSYGGIGALLDDSVAGQDSEGLRILYVFEGGSAMDAGIAARDRIIAVEGDACARIADIRGPEGTEVTLTVVSPGEEPRQVTLERRRIDPTILPEARRLEAAPSVGYLRIISLVGQETIDAVEQALTRLGRGEDGVEGLIIDLRASDQGAPGVVVEILRHFVEGEVGEFYTRVGSEAIEVEPSELADAYEGLPIVVLVDEDSQAEAEQLAAVLQDQGRATVVGEQTAGETHGARTVPFPDGSLLQIVSYGFRLPGGENLEGQGVTPDVEVDEDWLDYPEAQDPGLLAALEVIEAELAAPDVSLAPGLSAAPDPSPLPEPSSAASPVAEPTAATARPEPTESPAG